MLLTKTCSILLQTQNHIKAIFIFVFTQHLLNITFDRSARSEFCQPVPAVPLCIPYWLQRSGPAGLRGSLWRLPVVGFAVIVAAVVAPCPSRSGWGTSPPPCGPLGLREPVRTGRSYRGGPPVNVMWIGFRKTQQIIFICIAICYNTIRWKPYTLYIHNISIDNFLMQVLLIPSLSCGKAQLRWPCVPQQQRSPAV